MAWKLEGRHRNRKKMRSSRRNRSNGDNVSHRRNVDQAKAARAKAAIKAAKSQSPKSVYKNRKFKAAVDLETPKSLLVNIRLKSVINLDTYDLLSRKEKERLVLLLPSCDQQKDRSGMPILNSEALNNEFFAKACVEWCERLGEGEFLKDRQQGDASWKIRQFGTLNGAKSHVIESLSTDTKVNRGNRHSASAEPPLLHLSRLRNGCGNSVSVKLMSESNAALPPKRCRRLARNLRLQQLALDDGASLMSETSSESSLSLYGEQSRVGSSCLGYGGDSNCSATLGNNTSGRVAQREMPVNHNLVSFVHPALRDHDYVWPLRQFCAQADSTGDCNSKTSRSSTVHGRYRRRRNRKRVRSKKPDSVSAHRARGLVSEMQGHGSYTPNDLWADRGGIPLEADAVEASNALHVNGLKVGCKDDVANSQVLSLENTPISNPSVKSNGRLNGTYSPNKRDCGRSVSAQHLASAAAHNSWLKENDVNLNYVTRPSRLKTIQHLRKCEQTDGMPLIQIQGSDLLSRLSCAKSETDPSVRDPCNKDYPIVASSMCFSKTEMKSDACGDDSASPASDSQNARMASDVDRLSTGHSNSASLHRLDHVRSTESGLSNSRTRPDTRFFVKLIAIQKIPLDCETTDGKSNSRDVIRLGEGDASLDSITSSLPPSVLQEVQHYIRSGGNFPYVGQHSSSSSGQSNGPLVLGQHVEISFPSNSIRSQEDRVEDTLLRQTDTREGSLPNRNLQDFKLISDARNHPANCDALDLSDCVWEAVMHQKDAVDHGL